jgi:hypothetical protein
MDSQIVQFVPVRSEGPFGGSSMHLDTILMNGDVKIGRLAMQGTRLPGQPLYGLN